MVQPVILATMTCAITLFVTSPGLTNVRDLQAVIVLEASGLALTIGVKSYF